MCQGCPLSPTLFCIFFDGPHDHLQAPAPSASLQLRSGRWVSLLVYADDVALLSVAPQGPQQFCAYMDLTISPTKPQVFVVTRPSCQPHFCWHVIDQQLRVSASFKYLGLIFHESVESGSPKFPLARLPENGQDARSRLAAKHKELHYDQSFPMMRRLSDAVVNLLCHMVARFGGPSAVANVCQN